MPKRTHTYSPLDVLMASPTEPMPGAKSTYLMVKMTLALEEIKRGEKPNENDLKLLCDGVNLTKTLVENGYINDESGLLDVAVDAMAASYYRQQDGKPVRLSGEGIVAVASILQVYQEALETLSHRTILAMHRATEKRLWAILDGDVKNGDVVICFD